MFDLDSEGAYKAIAVLDNRYKAMWGRAWHNLEEARKPIVVVKEGKTYAFLAFIDTRLNTI